MHKGKLSWQTGESVASQLRMGVLLKGALQLLTRKEGSSPGVGVFLKHRDLPYSSLSCWSLFCSAAARQEDR